MQLTWLNNGMKHCSLPASQMKYLIWLVEMLLYNKSELHHFHY